MVFISRWGWLLLLLIFSLTGFYGSSIDNGVSHDRLKYLSIAWSMYQDGQYLIPMVNGVPYTDKPPLIFWLMTGFWHLFGLNMVALELLISCIFILWVLILRAIYARIFPDDHAGRHLLPYLFLGSYVIWHDVWFLRVDLLLVLGILFCHLGIFNSIASLQNPEKKTSSNNFIYITLGTCIGLLSKGPIIYVFTLLPFLVSILFDINYYRCLYKILGAIMLGTAIILFFWFIPAILSMGTSFAKQTLYEQIIHRAVYSDRHYFLKKSYFVYFYEYIPTLFLPWLINIVFIRKFINVTKEMRLFFPFILSFFILNTLLFSCYGQKSLWYVLPFFPIGLLFFSRFFSQCQNLVIVQKVNAVFFGMIYILFFICCMGLIYFPSIQHRIFKNFGGHFSLPHFPILFLAIISFIMFFYCVFFRSKFINLIKVVSVMFFLIYGLLNLIFFPFEKQFTHIETVGNYLHQQAMANHPIVLYRSGTDYLGQFNFSASLTKPILLLNTPDNLMQWLDTFPNTVVIYYGNSCPGNSRLHEAMFYQERANMTPYLLCVI